MSDSREVARRDDEDPWQRVREAVRRRVGERNFESWIASLRPVWTPERLRLEAPDRGARDRVDRHFIGAIREALAESGVDLVLEIEVAPPPVELPIRVRPPSPGHTFGTFVVGKSNETATQAARQLVDGRTTPLFLHGPSGVGKTHLLHAAAHELTARGIAVACLPAADLVAALVVACAAGEETELWRGLHPLGALLLDDVHSLAGQDEIQERLMEGLVAWMEGGRLLALTSDRAPADVPRLTAAVRAHCARGVVAAIDRPEPALRVAILERKAEGWGLTLDHRLATRIAGAVGGNVRRLEGVLTRLLAHAQLYGRRLDEALALEVLPELRLRPPTLPTVGTILDATASVFGVRVRMLIGRSRRAQVILPRQVAMYLARRLLRKPFSELAKDFSRDHTTVMQAWRQVTARLGVDTSLARVVAEIERRLGVGDP